MCEIDSLFGPGVSSFLDGNMQSVEKERRKKNKKEKIKMFTLNFLIIFVS